MKSIILLTIIILTMVSCITSKISIHIIKDMDQIINVMSYVQKKIKTEFDLKKINITVHNSDEIRVMIYDKDFVATSSVLNSDSICHAIANRVLILCKERDSSFLKKYQGIVITLAQNGNHLIRGSTIDINNRYTINR
jgi:uncharacterized protein YajQ (UPF0234 family)